ncbi:NADPH:quinone reductase [Tateyamaria omphalii]|uniref:NADPH:quinone reductase n=1 Tax=Tateyamaria omphalii TaxID=299262 RepID=UPI001C99477E|nr:NADPH:quinone reductase [Tateyamaria omphalii]MBY5935238.1 NADPH:quinone reductase [Tateyamaria omphalii]
MNCIQYSRFGPAADVLTLAHMPTPDPNPGEVLVELSYSGVNPSDVKARGGTRPGVTKPPFDAIIPHSDGAGRIVAVGDGISAERIGQRVWIWNGQWQRPFGTCATHICLPADQAVPLPNAVSDQTGAVLGIPGLTAAQAVFGSGDVKGKTLLIQGGAGTVGFLAVQLAKWGGARVIATAREAGLDRAREAGADAVLNYADPDLADHILAANDGTPVDRIIEVELGRNIDTDAHVIAPNGTIAVYGSALDMTPKLPFGPLLFKAATLDILLIYLLPKAERDACILHLHDALADGALSCPVAHVFPLTETAAAHEAVERGGRDGAILVEVQA